MQTITATKEQLAKELIETQAKLAQVTAAYQSLQSAHPSAPGGSKPLLRSAALKRRDEVGADGHRRLAARLVEVGTEIVAAFSRLHGEAIVSLYSVIGSEPDVAPLAQALAASGVPLALPVDWSHGGPLIYRRWTPGDRLAAGPLGIAEPLPDAPECVPDMMIMPLVAYDRRGSRIGYGAGNVDRTLVRLRSRKTMRVVGVAFSVQEELVIPADVHDQPVDVIVTERETITVTPLI